MKPKKTEKVEEKHLAPWMFVAGAIEWGLPRTGCVCEECQPLVEEREPGVRCPRRHSDEYLEIFTRPS